MNAILNFLFGALSMAAAAAWVAVLLLTYAKQLIQLANIILFEIPWRKKHDDKTLVALSPFIIMLYLIPLLGAFFNWLTELMTEDDINFKLYKKQYKKLEAWFDNAFWFACILIIYWFAFFVICFVCYLFTH